MTTGPISRYAEAWRLGDLNAMFEAYGRDVIVHYGGASEFAGTHVGRDRFVAVLLETSSRCARRLVAVDAVYDEETEGAIFAREAIVVDAVEHVVERCLRYRAAGDLLVEVWLYDHDQQLVDRAWATPAAQ
jgi:hypothetical protein